MLDAFWEGKDSKKWPPNTETEALYMKGPWKVDVVSKEGGWVQFSLTFCSEAMREWWCQSANAYWGRSFNFMISQESKI